MIMLIGEYNFSIKTDGTEDFVNNQDYLLCPGFKKIIKELSHKLNNYELEGENIVTFKVTCNISRTLINEL